MAAERAQATADRGDRGGGDGRREAARSMPAAAAMPPAYGVGALDASPAVPRGWPMRPTLSLVIGRSDDPSEQEADHIAERALASTQPPSSAAAARPAPGVPLLRRACAACEEERLQRRAGSGAEPGPTAPASVHQVLASPGRSLPESVRSYFEPRLGVDLADVRLHDDAPAHASARAVNALAYTVGQHIVFDRDRFAPETPAGRRLLAHELGHVVQGGAPAIRRKTGDDDPLTNVTLAQTSVEPLMFQVTLAFTKKSVSFPVRWSVDLTKVAMKLGEHKIGASPFYTDDSIAGKVVFTLPDQGGEYMWIIVTDETAADLIRARAYLLEHDPVPFHIVDETKTTTFGEDDGLGITVTGDGKGSGDTPKFVGASPWLTRELLPGVKASLAADFAGTQVGTLVPYVSLPIQASDGPDVELIQVNKPGSTAIAGHVRVDRRKWVGQDRDAQAAYARETAAAVVARLTAAGRQDRLKDLDATLAKADAGATAMPAWAIPLHAAVEKKLASARAAAPPGQPPADLPDRLHLVAVGDLAMFQIYIERPDPDDASKPAWQTAIMTPSLDESDARHLDALVRRVRKQTAFLRSRKVKAETSDEPPRTTILMPPIPAHIRALDLNVNGATATGATNKFRMAVEIETLSISDGVNSMEMLSLSESLGLRDVDFAWKVISFTPSNAGDLARPRPDPPKGRTAGKPSDVYFDLANRAIDQPSKVALATQQVDLAAVMASGTYAVADVNHGELEHRFPELPGVYLVVAEVTPRPTTNEKYRRVYPPSRAVFPIRVQTSRDLAAETVSQATDAIAAKEAQREDPTLDDRQRITLDADIARMKAQEGMTQLEVTRVAKADIDRNIARFAALKTWLIADRADHHSPYGTATYDPLDIRLFGHDRRHDTHLFASFRDLVGMYGELAYDLRFLNQPIDSKDGQLSVLNQHLKLLQEQKAQAQKLATTIAEGEEKFLGGVTQQVVATLVIAETGTVVPLLLLVGQQPDSRQGAYKYKIIDLTLAAQPGVYSMKKQTYAPDGTAATLDEAMRNAFVEFGEDSSYDDGMIHYRLAGQSALQSVETRVTLTEYAEKAAMFLAIIGMVASVVASGGATAPAVATVIAAITIASAVVAVATSYEHLKRRSAAGTLELDADAVLDVVNIIASVVGVGALAKGRQLEQLAQGARAAGNVTRAAAAMAKIEQLGRTMLLFDTAVLGTTAVVTAVKVTDDIAAVKALHLPPEKEAALLQQIASDAVIQGAMMAFQTVMLARSHLEMYRGQVENSRYKTLEERGWVDGEGRVTDLAPPVLRAPAADAAPAVGERPPVALESDLPLVKAAAEAGGVERLPNDPEHDISIGFQDKNNEPHSFKRRREDGGWCRYSDPYCFFSKKDLDTIDKAFEAMDPERVGSGEIGADHSKFPKWEGPPSRRGAAGVPGKSWGKIGGDAATLTETIEATIQQAIKGLRATLGKKSLPPREYGISLHGVVADLFRGMKLPRGWKAFVEQPLRNTGIDPAVAKTTVRSFLDQHYPELIDQLSPKFFVKKNGQPQLVGDIEADLILVGPDGTKIAWDLAPTETPEHVAKTLIYGLADTAAGRVQVGETYYHPERNLDLDAAAQARFRGKGAENARLTIADDKAQSLARRFLGKGTPQTPDLPADPALRAKVVAARAGPKAVAPTPLPAGYAGAVELVTDGNTVVGQVYDPGTATWSDTTNFTIHYTSDGAYIRPEAP